MEQAIRWFLEARHKFVWDVETIQPYSELFSEIVWQIIEDRRDDDEEIAELTSPEIGFFPFSDEADPDKVSGYALYIAEVRLLRDRRRTLYSDFRERYRMVVGSAFDELFGPNDDIIQAVASPERAEQLIRWINELVRDFQSIAARSLNRSRRINPQLRYQVLMRDASTCQSCGRQAPEVRVHLDHIAPLSWDVSWHASDNPDDYQVLCEECNLGKGSLDWLTSV